MTTPLFILWRLTKWTEHRGKQWNAQWLILPRYYHGNCRVVGRSITYLRPSYSLRCIIIFVDRHRHHTYISDDIYIIIYTTVNITNQKNGGEVKTRLLHSYLTTTLRSCCECCEWWYTLDVHFCCFKICMDLDHCLHSLFCFLGGFFSVSFFRWHVLVLAWFHPFGSLVRFFDII